MQWYTHDVNSVIMYVDIDVFETNICICLLLSDRAYKRGLYMGDIYRKLSAHKSIYKVKRRLNMKKTLALIISMFMLFGVLTACSDVPAVSTQPSTQPGATASVVPQESQAPVEPEALTLPIVSEKVTYKIWNGPKNSTSGMESPNDSSAYQEAESTNIHIDWMQPAYGQEQEQFNLIIAEATGFVFGGLDYMLVESTNFYKWLILILRT